MTKLFRLELVTGKGGYVASIVSGIVYLLCRRETDTYYEQGAKHERNACCAKALDTGGGKRVECVS